MKKSIAQINKDLDLRRFGKDVYSKALNKGSNSSSDDTQPQLINFTLEGNVYTAVKDMRWLDLIFSDYSPKNQFNSKLFVIKDNSVYYTTYGNPVYRFSGAQRTYVLPTDIIIEGESYGCDRQGGSND